ncbi:hypothetical protein F1912_12220 [Akkermansia muciniphila]|nr:hypothetical protein F1912_12220 [Akkermansia muciniphila]
MSVGEVIRERMDMLGISVDQVSDTTLHYWPDFEDVLSGTVQIDTADIDDYELSMLGNAMLCSPAYFTSVEERDKDIVHQNYGRSNVTIKTLLQMARIQQFMRDLHFLKSL